MQHGWTASFIGIFDESWVLSHQISKIIKVRDVLICFFNVIIQDVTGNEMCMDLLAFYVDPKLNASGFEPHRDRQPAELKESFYPDGLPSLFFSTQLFLGTPKYTTVRNNSILHFN